MVILRIWTTHLIAPLKAVTTALLEPLELVDELLDAMPLHVRRQLLGLCPGKRRALGKQAHGGWTDGLEDRKRHPKYPADSIVSSLGEQTTHTSNSGCHDMAVTLALHC